MKNSFVSGFMTCLTGAITALVFSAGAAVAVLEKYLAAEVVTDFAPAALVVWQETPTEKYCGKVSPESLNAMPRTGGRVNLIQYLTAQKATAPALTAVEKQACFGDFDIKGIPSPAKGVITVTAEPFGVTPTGFDFYVDDKLTSQEYGAPYSLGGDDNYDTKKLTDGAHTLKVTMFYVVGGKNQKYTREQAFTVQNGIVSPPPAAWKVAPLAVGSRPLYDGQKYEACKNNISITDKNLCNSKPHWVQIGSVAADGITPCESAKIRDLTINQEYHYTTNAGGIRGLTVCKK